METTEAAAAATAVAQLQFHSIFKPTRKNKGGGDEENK